MRLRLVAKREEILSPDAPPVAHEIYRRMTDLGMSKKGLAIEAGLGATYIHDLFRGKSRNAQIDHLKKVAKVLGCSVEDLVHPVRPGGGPESHEGSDPTGILPLLPDDVAMIRLWRILPKRAKDLVLLRITELLPRHLRHDGG